MRRRLEFVAKLRDAPAAVGKFREGLSGMYGPSCKARRIAGGIAGDVLNCFGQIGES